MDSEVIAADLACDQEEFSGDSGGSIGRGSQKSCTDQKQPIIPPSVSVLCSTCALPRWESDWSFSIEDGVPMNKNDRGDLMKDKAGKGQKMRRNKGRVLYRRAPHVLFSA
uniref:Uncharacterized protein n=1 Tax=Picea sitchensis TaxID=3332 RepID=A9NNU1_PICSI|nr:unknown [Picea sitchensis]